MSDSPIRTQVMVVGAGAAGLYAASLFQQEGISVSILEASNRHGGRIRALTDPNFSDFPIELGAENIHGHKNQKGEENSFLYRDIQELDANRLRRVFSSNRDQDELYEIDDTTVWDSTYDDRDIDRVWKFDKKAGKYKGDDIPMSEHLKRKGIDENSRCWHFYQAFIGAEYGTSIRNIGMRSFALERREWQTGASDYSIDGHGYLDTLDELYFRQVLPLVRYETAVTHVTLEKEGVLIRDASGVSHQAQKLLITVPLTILKSGMINFQPGLPATKLEAIRTIGMDTGMKVVLAFGKRFWPKRMMSFLTRGPIGMGWAPGKVQSHGSNRFLTCFVMGDAARNLSGLSEDNLRDTCLTELDRIFPKRKASKHFQAIRVMDWSREPFIGGAYSYPAVGVRRVEGESMRNHLAAPIHDRIFFAGEATAKHHPATVHGALESGRRAVREMLHSLHEERRANS